MISRANETLRLVQFNVENLFLFLDLYNGQNFEKITEAEWQKQSSSTTSNKPLRKVRLLTQTLREINADIIMLNEVGGVESLENYNRYFLSDEYNVHLKEGNSNRGIDVGYLIRKDLPYKAILLTHKDRPIDFLYPHESQTPSGGKSHYFSRDVAELRLFNPDNSVVQLAILLTHLKSKLDTDRIDQQGQLRRRAELKKLTEIYNEVRKELGPQVPVIVAGDMNGIASQTQTEPEFLPVYETTDLVELLEFCKKPANERYTQVQITPMGHQQFMQLDYIFVSPNLCDRVIPEKSGVHYYKNELGHRSSAPRNIDERMLLASDHYPVVMTLKI